MQRNGQVSMSFILDVESVLSLGLTGLPSFGFTLPLEKARQSKSIGTPSHHRSFNHKHSFMVDHGTLVFLEPSNFPLRALKIAAVIFSRCSYRGRLPKSAETVQECQCMFNQFNQAYNELHANLSVRTRLTFRNWTEVIELAQFAGDLR